MRLASAWALGAQPKEIVASVVRDQAKVLGLGSAAGLAVAFTANRLLTSILFEVKPADAGAFAVVVAILGAIALSACFFAALQAARIDPAAAMRAE